MTPKVTFIRCRDMIQAAHAVSYFLDCGECTHTQIGIRNSMWVTQGDNPIHAVYWTNSKRNSITCMRDTSKDQTDD